MSLPDLNWPADGLIPVVIQDDETDDVLMLGFMNQESLAATQTTNQVHFWSRSRNELWHKGGSSGHVQNVHSISVNCDLNSLLIRVEQIGAVCHDGYSSCYYRDVLEDGSLELNQDRLFDPRDVYGDGLGLEGLSRLWWGAYEWLRDHDLVEVSGTSRLLRSRGTSVMHRIQDELTELAGVLDGTHVHTNQQEDFLLESSQCLYWIAVNAIGMGLRFEEIRPDRQLDVQDASVNADVASRVLRAEAKVLDSMSTGVATHLIRIIAECARTLDIDPREILESDLSELRSKPYLAEFFAR